MNTRGFYFPNKDEYTIQPRSNLQLGIPLALPIAPVIVLVCVLRNARAELNRPLNELRAFAQPQFPCRLTQDAFVTHPLWLA